MLFIIYNLCLLVPIRHCLLILGGYYNKPKKLHCKYMLLCETALGEMETRQNGRQSRYNPYTHDYSQVNTSFVKKCILLYYYYCLIFIPNKSDTIFVKPFSLRRSEIINILLRMVIHYLLWEIKLLRLKRMCFVLQ